jgi:hypothetical protein
MCVSHPWTLSRERSVPVCLQVDMMEWLRREFSNPAYRGYFVLRGARRYTPDGKR